MHKFDIVSNAVVIAETCGTDRDVAFSTALTVAATHVRDSPVSIFEHGTKYVLHMATGEQIRERKKARGTRK